MRRSSSLLLVSLFSLVKDSLLVASASTFVSFLPKESEAVLLVESTTVPASSFRLEEVESSSIPSEGTSVSCFFDETEGTSVSCFFDESEGFFDESKGASVSCFFDESEETSFSCFFDESEETSFSCFFDESEETSVSCFFDESK